MPPIQTRIHLAGRSPLKAPNTTAPHKPRLRRHRFLDSPTGKYRSYMESLSPDLYYRFSETGTNWDVTDQTANKRDAFWRKSEGPPDSRPVGRVDFDTSVKFSDVATSTPTKATIQTYDYNPMVHNSSRTYVMILKRDTSAKFDSFMGNSLVPGPTANTGAGCTLEFIADTSIYWYGCIDTQFPFGWRWDNLPPAGTWWHLVFTVRDNNVGGDFDQPNGAQTVELFVNGQSKGNGFQDTPGFGHDNGPDSYWYPGGTDNAGNPITVTSGQLMLGNHGNFNPGEWSAVAMDEFATFHRILTNNEIANLAAAGGWLSLTPPTEVASARALTKNKCKLLTKATQVDTARTVGIAVALGITKAVEVDSSRALSAAKLRVLTQAVEVTSARPLDIANRISLGVLNCVETDTAQPLDFVNLPGSPVIPPVAPEGPTNPEISFLELYRIARY